MLRVLRFIISRSQEVNRSIFFLRWVLMKKNSTQSLRHLISEINTIIFFKNCSSSWWTRRSTCSCLYFRLWSGREVFRFHLKSFLLVVIQIMRKFRTEIERLNSNFFSETSPTRLSDMEERNFDIILLITHLNARVWRRLTYRSDAHSRADDCLHGFFFVLLMSLAHLVFLYLSWFLQTVANQLNVSTEFASN